MCLIVRGTDARRTAQNDIVCYKVVFGGGYKDCFTTPYQYMHVELGKDYHNTDPEKIFCGSIVGVVSVHCGFFHSFSHLESAITEARYFNHVDGRPFYVIRCIIPNGSDYYAGEYLLAASGSSELSYASKDIKYESIVYEAKDRTFV